MYKRILISDYYQQKNNSQIFFNKQVTDSDRCNIPWQYLIINRNGEAYICHSPAWLPKSIGSILDYDDLFSLLNSPEALSIRTEILENRYTFCNHNICGSYFGKLDKSKFNPQAINTPLKINQQYHPDAYVSIPPLSVVFDFDQTCNFQCPSCRTEVINYNTGPESEINSKVVEKIKSVLLSQYAKVQYPRTFRWAGGEPFISRAYLELWEHIISLNNHNLKNIIQTNGSYLNKKKELLKEMMPYISQLRISFDAGSADTYAKIRKNGNWNTLLQNCQLASTLSEGHDTILTGDFVVQLDNYKEIPNYINTCKKLKFQKIILSKMWNWGTWETETFTHLNVSNSEHPLYNEFIKIITPYKDDPIIDLSYWKNDII